MGPEGLVEGVRLIVIWAAAIGIGVLAWRLIHKGGE